MFFCLDTKEPKSQERNDIQHVSFIRPDVAFVLLTFQQLNIDIVLKTNHAAHHCEARSNLIIKYKALT